MVVAHPLAGALRERRLARPGGGLGVLGEREAAEETEETEETVLVYVLLEHQSTPRRWMALRVLNYACRCCISHNLAGRFPK